MAQRDIREYSGKSLLRRYWNDYFGPNFKLSLSSVLVSSSDELRSVVSKYDWLSSGSLVVKPDMLFGKRGKNNLVYLKDKVVGDVSLDLACDWIDKYSQKEVTLLSGERGALTHFIVEPFRNVESKSYYIALSSESGFDRLSLSTDGGVDIEENWESVFEIQIPVDASPIETRSLIFDKVCGAFQEESFLSELALSFYKFFRDFHFSYLELNPFLVNKDTIYALDLVAKLDDCASFLMSEKWGALTFPTSFGMKELTEEETFIHELDSGSGASLKLTLLNPKGRVWTLVAGGGASVVYADTISDLVGVNELANYGEYSGNPSTEETYQYTKMVLKLLTDNADEDGLRKIILIGGAIANFTDVSKTFGGIIKAFQDYGDDLKRIGTDVYVRRGGPNFEKGLKNIKVALDELSIPVCVFGPETHITDIVRMSVSRKD